MAPFGPRGPSRHVIGHRACVWRPAMGFPVGLHLSCGAGQRAARGTPRQAPAPPPPATAGYKLLIIEELGVPLSATGAELPFEVLGQRYERCSIIVASNLPFDEWTSVFGSERLTCALLDTLTHHVYILEMNGDSFQLKQAARATRSRDPAGA